jgi:hypothetical protein
MKHERLRGARETPSSAPNQLFLHTTKRVQSNESIWSQSAHCCCLVGVRYPDSDHQGVTYRKRVIQNWNLECSVVRLFGCLAPTTQQFFGWSEKWLFAQPLTSFPTLHKRFSVSLVNQPLLSAPLPSTIVHHHPTPPSSL